jgi:hypothetical protein
MDNCLWKAAKLRQLKDPSLKLRNEQHVFPKCPSVFSAFRKITALPFRHYISFENRGVQIQRKTKSSEPMLVMRCRHIGGISTMSPALTSFGGSFPTSTRPLPVTM